MKIKIMKNFDEDKGDNINLDSLNHKNDNN